MKKIVLIMVIISVIPTIVSSETFHVYDEYEKARGYYNNEDYWEYFQHYRFLLYMLKAKLDFSREDMRDYYSQMESEYLDTVSIFSYVMVLNDQNRIGDVYASDFVFLFKNDPVFQTLLDDQLLIRSPTSKPDWKQYKVSVLRLEYIAGQKN